MVSTVEAVPDSRDCADAADASSGVGAGDGRDDGGDDEEIRARGTVDLDNGDPAGKPELEDSATDATLRPSRSAIDTAPRHPSCQSDRPWSAGPRMRRTRSNERGTPSPWLASLAPRRGSRLDIWRIVSYCRTF